MSKRLGAKPQLAYVLNLSLTKRKKYWNPKEAPRSTRADLQVELRQLDPSRAIETVWKIKMAKG